MKNYVVREQYKEMHYAGMIFHTSHTSQFTKWEKGITILIHLLDPFISFPSFLPDVLCDLTNAICR